jgi:segregation and condensation protein A
MTATLAQEAIAALLELAERGEINPWDVQVIDIIDRFLTELGLPHDLELAYQQANLPRSGQAFLWASRLVLFKAETLEQLEIVGEEGDLAELEELGAAASFFALHGRLESRLRRRSSVPPPQRRHVTLQELIAQIEKMAAELEQVSAAPSVKRPRLQSRKEAVRSITELAHQENLTETASQLEQFFQLELPRLAPGRTSLDFEELVEWWQQVQPEGERPLSGNRVGLFWALLLLSSQSKVELSQAEFYQDLTIQVL